MPPRRKRTRDSTGNAGSAAATSTASVPGSAPPAGRRRMRSNGSASSQQEDDFDGESGPRAAKKSKRGGIASRATDSEDDVDMDEVANGGVGTASPAAAGRAAQKSGSALQPANKRGRTSASSASAATRTTSAGPPPAATPTPSRQEGIPPVSNGGSATAAAIDRAGIRPPLPKAPASRTTAGVRAGAGARESVAPSGGGSGAAAGAAGAGAPPSGGRRADPAPVFANGSDGGVGAAAVKAKAQHQAQDQARTSPGCVSSPVPAARLRRVTGPESTTGDDENSVDGNSGGGGAEGRVGGGAEEGFLRRFRAAASRGRDTLWRVCTKCFREVRVDTSDLLPVVRSLTLRCWRLLIFLGAAIAIWRTTLWVAGGLMATGGTGGGTGGGGEGVPPRHAALSVVRQMEGFQSLQEVLVERRRYLQEMEAKVAEEQGTLKSLRELVDSVEGQMELLRDQVAGGEASRGSPENPQASEVVSLSQLQEVQTMQDQLAALLNKTSDTVEAGHQWALAAAEDLASRTSSSALLSSTGQRQQQQLSPEDKAELDLQAEEEWANIYAPPLERAFLDVEGIYGKVEKIIAMSEAKPGAKEGAALARRVEQASRSSAAAAATAGDARQTNRLRERVEAVAAREMQVKWGGVGDSDSSGSGSLEVLRTTEEAEELVAREVEIFTSGGTGMPDYASVVQGASVIRGSLIQPEDTTAVGGRRGIAVEGQQQWQQPPLELLTSPSLARTTPLPWTDHMLHVLRLPGRVFAEGADAALSPSNSLGSCFAFRGGQGTLTVKLASRGSPSSSSSPTPSPSASSTVQQAAPGFVMVTHVSIEHARTALAPNVGKSAPRAFRVLGWDTDPAAATSAAGSGATARSMTLGKAVVDEAKGRRGAGSRGAGAAGPGRGEAPLTGAAPVVLRPHVLLDGAEYRVDAGAPGVQTFAVSQEARETVPPVGWVTLEVLSNHGLEWTCLYGFRVHGDPVD